MIPRTIAPDGEAIDAVVIGQESVAPVSVLRARAIGILCYERDGVRDDKVIAVHADDPAFRQYDRFDQLPAHWRAMLTRFFEDYRSLESKAGHVLGFEGPDAALSQIRSGHAAYNAARPFETGCDQPRGAL
jgi:inorganic pyrophosphatase